MGMRIASVICLAVCGAAANTRAEAASPSAEGFDALQLVVGNTMIVTGAPGGERLIYLGKDGTLHGLIDGRADTGRWTFADGKLCFVKGTAGKPECGALRVDGKAGTFTIEGHQIAFTLKSGDASAASAAASSTPAPSASSSASSSAAPAPGPRITGSKASDALVGNTLEGTIESKGLTTVFLNKDGTARIRQGEKVITGRWSTRADAMCIDVEGRKDCFTVEVDGTKVTWRNEKKDLPPLVFTLLTGNARNL